MSNYDGRVSVQVIHGGVGGSSTTGASAWHTTTWHTAWHTWHATGGTGSLWASSLVDSHHDWVELGLKLLLLLLDGLSLLRVGLKELETLSGGVLDGLLILIGEVGLQLLLVEGVLHLEAVVLKTVLGLNLLSDGVILSSELVSVGDHLLDLLLGEATLVVGNGDLLGLTSGLVTSGHVEDTVGIDIEGDLNLRSTTGRGRDTLEVELSEQVVVLGHLTLTLVNLDHNTWLVVSVGGEGLLLLGGNAGVTGNEDGHDTTGSLNTLGKRGDIEEEEVLDLLTALTGEDSSLDGSTVGDSLIWVDGSVELLAVEEVLEHALDLGDTGGATNKNDLVDLGLGDVSILEDLLDGRHALAELRHAKLLELGTGHVDVEILTLGESLAVDLRLMGAGENSLGLLALSSKTTHGTSVALDVNTGLLLESLDAEVDEDVVEVLTTQVGVAIGGLDLENTILNGEEGHVKSATTKIEDENVLLALTLLVETVSDSGSGGLVDDTGHVEASNGTGILGGLSLGVIEVSGDSDDGTGDGLAEVSLSDLLHLDEDHGGDFLGLELLLLALEVDDNERLLTGTGLDLEWPESDVVLDGAITKLATDESLGVEDSVGWVSGGLVLRGITDETLLLGEGDVGWGGVNTLVVGNDLDLLVLPDTDARVGGAKINSD